MLVVPCLAWASGFASPSDEDLHAIKKEVLQLFNPNFGQEAARVSVFEQLGWELEPQFAVDVSCLRELWRLATAPPAWMDTAPLNKAFAKWHELFPRAKPLLVRLGWHLTVTVMS